MLGVLRAAIPGAAFAQTWPNLVNLWTFDETSAAGGVFADSDPAKVPMTIVGTWADLSTGSLVQDTPGTSAYTDGSGHATIPANHPAHDLPELTISFYYQRNSAAAKHILLAAGDGTQVGDFSIEVLPNGRLRGYHVGLNASQNPELRFFESTNGITGTDLQVGAAHRIDLTLGSLGARIYLDGEPLTSGFILANTNSWNNSRTKYLGIFPGGTLSPADGAFDGLRIWDRQLNSAQVATLEPAQSVTLPQASAGVHVGTLDAFTRSAINVTALTGWPAGRLPKQILQQGARASAYVRRAWKPTLNSGTHIDFVAGWQKTTAQETIRLQLDDNSEIDVTYEVGHTVPAPTGGGVTRTLDRTATPGGTTYNTWAAAVGALTSGDVLVVRARTGTWTDSGGNAIPNYVYDVTTNPAPSSGVANVTIVAHPDDVAAGRRPVIWRNAGRYARYKYAAASNWQVHANLGGSHGTIYESVTTSTQPGHSIFAAYRDQVGDWIVLYNYQAISDATDRTGIMHDTSYSGYSGENSNTYMGPSLLYNKSNGRFEVRLSPPVKQTYMDPSSSAPFPPWDWTKHYPASTNPASVEIVITDGNDVNNWNTLLNLDARNGWKFYNLDFIYGNSAIFNDNITVPPQFFGCNFLGGAPPEFNHNGLNISFTGSGIRAFTQSANQTADLLLDRCGIHGANAPWGSWAEGKGFEGAYGLMLRRSFAWYDRTSVVFRYCSLNHWWHLSWSGGTPVKWHFHHCYMRSCGMDGSLIQPATGAHMVNRCFAPGFVWGGWSSNGGSGLIKHYSFNVDLHLHAWGCTIPNKNKWANTGERGAAVPCYAMCRSIGHGGRSVHSDWNFHNTCVGTQNTPGAENFDSFEGPGSGIGPDTREGNSRCLNSIGAVYPSPFAWPCGISALVGLYSNKTGGNVYDYNILFKSAGMLSPGLGSNTFFKVNGGSGAGTAYADIAALRSGTGFEINGAQANPQFVVTPAYASSNPYAAGAAFDMANYLLGSGSPARTGARNLNDQSFPDYDFETLTTWAGGANAPWRGALQPDVPAIEQEVGIVGPQPPKIV